MELCNLHFLKMCLIINLRTVSLTAANLIWGKVGSGINGGKKRAKEGAHSAEQLQMSAGMKTAVAGERGYTESGLDVWGKLDRETTEGGERQARRDRKGRVAGEWNRAERREMKEGDEGERENWRKGNGREWRKSFSSQPYTVSSKQLSSTPHIISLGWKTTLQTPRIDTCPKKWPLTVITSLPFGIMQYHFFMHFIATGIYLKRKMKSPKRFPLIIDKVSFTSQLNTEAFLSCRTWLELNDLFFFCSAGNQRGTCTGILVQRGADTRKTNMSIY